MNLSSDDVPSDSGASTLMQAKSIMMVAVNSLRAADSPRLAGENSDHIRVLAESGRPLPPIIVHRETMRVIDGMHRLAAARLRGQHEIEVVFVSGDEDDLFVLAVESNIKHGLALTLTDRKAAATRILASHAHWSDRKIASVTGLSPSTVGSIRSRSTDEYGHSNRRGIDGARRPHSTAAGRTRAYELLTERPDASVREIASIVGIAPSTVHDVKQRMRQGREPVPPSQLRAGERFRELRAPGGGVVAPLPHTGISVAQLRIDPILRHSEAGRVLLRLLSTHLILQERIAQLAAVVPGHLVGEVAALARRAGDVWHSFSDKLTPTTHQSVG